MDRVDEAACTGCGDCVEACPAGAIALMDGRAYIEPAACADCGSCAAACPQGAIVMAASPAYRASIPATSTAALSPSPAVIASTSRAGRPEIELRVDEPHRSRIWPMVGGALAWAARELLPELLAAWRTSRLGILQPMSRKSTTSDLAVSKQRRAGQRHRWGRA